MSLSLLSPYRLLPLGALRRRLRAVRRALSPREQRRHGLALARRLGHALRFLRARRIAAYWPADGELDPRPLLASAMRRGCQGFLPVLAPGKTRQLRFLRYRPGDPLRPNRLGIPEPKRRRPLTNARSLDLLLVPLVGFDAACNRLGMGGGYYDRTLHFRLRGGPWRRPRLIGIAHECQRVARLRSRAWDVPLDGVATERGLYWRGRKARTRDPKFGH